MITKLDKAISVINFVENLIIEQIGEIGKYNLSNSLLLKFISQNNKINYLIPISNKNRDGVSLKVFSPVIDKNEYFIELLYRYYSKHIDGGKVPFLYWCKHCNYYHFLCWLIYESSFYQTELAYDVLSNDYNNTITD